LHLLYFMACRDESPLEAIILVLNGPDAIAPAERRWHIGTSLAGGPPLQWPASNLLPAHTVSIHIQPSARSCDEFVLAFGYLDDGSWQVAKATRSLSGGV
jgi:hypothetical protein